MVKLRVACCAVVSAALLSVPSYALTLSDLEMAVSIKSIDLDVLCTGSIRDIEDELYPSGLTLPTKYNDLLDFVPYDLSLEPDDATTFLRVNFPAEEYTWAEYKAVDRYLELSKTDYFKTNVRTTNVSNTEVDNLSYFHQQLQGVRDDLEYLASVKHSPIAEVTSSQQYLNVFDTMLTCGEVYGYDVDTYILKDHTGNWEHLTNSLGLSRESSDLQCLWTQSLGRVVTNKETPEIYTLYMDWMSREIPSEQEDLAESLEPDANPRDADEAYDLERELEPEVKTEEQIQLRDYVEELYNDSVTEYRGYTGVPVTDQSKSNFIDVLVIVSSCLVVGYFLFKFIYDLIAVRWSEWFR